VTVVSVLILEDRDRTVPRPHCTATAQHRTATTMVLLTRVLAIAWASAWPHSTASATASLRPPQPPHSLRSFVPRAGWRATEGAPARAVWNDELACALPNDESAPAECW